MKKLLKSTSRNRSKRIYNRCANAIKRTLAYRATFSYPLSFHQLTTFLISSRAYDLKEVSRELERLLRSKEVINRNGLFSLRESRQVVDWYAGVRESNELANSSKEVFDWIKKIPWVRMLSITGSVAASNASKGADIDIFVIAQKNRLWITRFFVVLILKACDFYRTASHPEGKICPNLFISEATMPWPENQRNIFVAHEILFMRPVIDRDGTYFKFLEANRWVFEHFSNQNVLFSNSSIPAYLSESKRSSQNLLFYVEKLLMKFQVLYMKKNRTKEVVEIDVIHFNKFDNSNKILENYKKTLDLLALSLVE